MILADSSVWIDYFRNVSSPQTDRLAELLLTEQLGMCDLVITEVLQGTGSEFEFARILKQFRTLPIIQISTPNIAVQAAQNYRTLRAKGITVRKTIDTLIATRCIVDGLTLLYSDRDFDPFVAQLGLLSAMDAPPA
jgi:predicted nucleic acid-binding protein